MELQDFNLADLASTEPGSRSHRLAPRWCRCALRRRPRPERPGAKGTKGVQKCEVLAGKAPDSSATLSKVLLLLSYYYYYYYYYYYFFFFFLFDSLAA